MRIENLEVRIGLKIYIPLTSDTKLFSNAVGSLNKQKPNSRVNAYDAGYPGALPTVNRACLEAGLKLALALGCKISRVTSFDCLYSFDPRVPVGYRLCQYYKPLARGGQIDIAGLSEKAKWINFEFLRLMPQVGRLSKQGLFRGLDLNSVNDPMIELVSAVHLASTSEAVSLLTRIRTLLMNLEICTEQQITTLTTSAAVTVLHCNGAYCQVGGLLNDQQLARGIKYEIERQYNLLRRGETLRRSTFELDQTTGDYIQVEDQRSRPKIEYLPDPNLPPIKITNAMLRKVRADLELQ